MSKRYGVGKTIAIVGGGATGTLTAYHLSEGGADARIVVIDPRPELGLGLAYSTPSLRHLLNVPAGKISAVAGQCGHFLEGLREHFDRDATGATFAPRAVFGRYVNGLLAGTAGVEQVRGLAIGCRRVESGAVLTLDNGEEVWADVVV